MSIPPMKQISPGLPHRPFFILACGLMSLAMGILLVCLGPEIHWYGAGVIVCSLGLIVMWIRDREPKPNINPNSISNPDGATAEPVPVRYNVPGPWYPIALMAIVVLQVCWALYLKHR